jgi:hypothetical protein
VSNALRVELATGEATEDEKLKERKSFTQCCQKNKVTLPAFHESARPYPEYLKKLLTASTAGESTSQIVALHDADGVQRCRSQKFSVADKNLQKLNLFYVAWSQH